MESVIISMFIEDPNVLNTYYDYQIKEQHKDTMQPQLLKISR